MSQECEMAEEALIAKQARIDELERFARSLLHPEVFGLSVPAEVRDEARHVLGIPKCETGRRQWQDAS